MSRVHRLVGGLAGAAAGIAVITAASRVTGFGRWVVQSYSVGQTPTGTAYATANLLPNVLFEVVAGGALAGAVVPLLAAPFARGLRAEVDRTASALLTWVLVVLVPASVLLAVFARPIVALLIPPARPGTDPALTAASLDLGAQLLVVFAPQVVLYGIGAVLTGVLQAQRRFFGPAAAPIASSAVVIVVYLVFRGLAGTDVEDPSLLSTSAVAWLGWGTTAGVAAMSLVLLAPVLRSGVRLRPTFGFPPGVARRAVHLGLAGIGGLVAQQAAVVATARLANDHGETGGTINLFQYSQAVYFLPYAVLAVPLATAVFPRLAEHVGSGDHVRYRRLVSVSTRVILLVTGAGAAAMIAAAPAVAVVFGTVDASNDPAAVAAMSPTLTLLAPGLLGYALMFQVSRVLFALEHGRAAVTSIATGWLAVVVASVVAVRVLAPHGGDGVRTLIGLALGNTIGMLVGGVVLLVAVARAAGRPAVAGVLRTGAVVVVAGTAAALAGRWVVDRLLEPSGAVGALLVGGLGALVALLVALAVSVLGDRQTVRASRAHVGLDVG